GRKRLRTPLSMGNRRPRQSDRRRLWRRKGILQARQDRWRFGRGLIVRYLFGIAACRRRLQNLRGEIRRTAARENFVQQCVDNRIVSVVESHLAVYFSFNALAQ